eukprot:6208678-Pleurochrysis_carterae.AAC.1
MKLDRRTSSDACTVQYSRRSRANASRVAMKRSCCIGPVARSSSRCSLLKSAMSFSMTGTRSASAKVSSTFSTVVLLRLMRFRTLRADAQVPAVDLRFFRPPCAPTLLPSTSCCFATLFHASRCNFAHFRRRRNEGGESSSADRLRRSCVCTTRSGSGGSTASLRARVLRGTAASAARRREMVASDTGADGAAPTHPARLPAERSRAPPSCPPCDEGAPAATAGAGPSPG